MKNKFLALGVILIAVLCIYMIGVGAMGRSSDAKQSIFVHALHEPLNQAPSFYLKGCTVPDRVTLDFSQVDIDHAGTYDVRVNQQGSSYTFQIKVEG